MSKLSEILEDCFEAYPAGYFDTERAVKEVEAYYTDKLEAEYRRGYNDNARDCFCDNVPFKPHHHLMDDGKSHNIRPDIKHD